MVIKRLLVIVLIIILVGIGAYFLTKDNKQTNSTVTGTQSITQSPTQKVSMTVQ